MTCSVLTPPPIIANVLSQNDDASTSAEAASSRPRLPPYRDPSLVARLIWQSEIATQVPWAATSFDLELAPREILAAVLRQKRSCRPVVSGKAVAARFLPRPFQGVSVASLDHSRY